MATILLSGATVDWIRDNTSWGTEDDKGGDEIDKVTRGLVLAAPSRKVGATGSLSTVELDLRQVYALWSYLDSLAAFGESMTPAERGENAYAFQAVRRDVKRFKSL